MHQAKVVLCGEDRYELAFRLCSVCDSSRHSQEPSGEAFNAMYRQETHTDNTWIILNHPLFTARKNVSGGSFILIMYRSVTQYILHYCVIALCVCGKWLSAVLDCHPMWHVCCLLFQTALSTLTLVCVSFCVIQANSAGLCTSYVSFFTSAQHSCLFFMCVSFNPIKTL